MPAPVPGPCPRDATGSSGRPGRAARALVSWRCPCGLVGRSWHEHGWPGPQLQPRWTTSSSGPGVRAGRGRSGRLGPSLARVGTSNRTRRTGNDGVGVAFLVVAPSRCPPNLVLRHAEAFAQLLRLWRLPRVLAQAMGMDGQPPRRSSVGDRRAALRRGGLRWQPRVARYLPRGRRGVRRRWQRVSGRRPSPPAPGPARVLGWSGRCGWHGRPGGAGRGADGRWCGGGRVGRGG
jgi:hypothetical protein